jgi:hypothetical protein
MLCLGIPINKLKDEQEFRTTICWSVDFQDSHFTNYYTYGFFSSRMYPTFPEDQVIYSQ